MGKGAKVIWRSSTYLKSDALVSSRQLISPPRSAGVEEKVGESDTTGATASGSVAGWLQAHLNTALFVCLFVLFGWSGWFFCVMSPRNCEGDLHDLQTTSEECMLAPT